MFSAAVALALAALAAPAEANLISNGSFEANTQAAGTYGIYNTLSGGWTGAPNIELRNNVDGTAQQGSNFVELDVNFNSAMSQTFSVASAGTYLLSFFYASRPGTSFETNGLAVNVSQGGSAVFSASVNPSGNSGSTHNWLSFSQSIGSLSVGLYTLSFSATGSSDSFGTSLDNISVVPEPGSMALLLAGLGAVGFVAARRRNGI